MQQGALPCGLCGVHGWDSGARSVLWCDAVSEAAARRLVRAGMGVSVVGACVPILLVGWWVNIQYLVWRHVRWLEAAPSTARGCLLVPARASTEQDAQFIVST